MKSLNEYCVWASTRLEWGTQHNDNGTLQQAQAKLKNKVLHILGVAQPMYTGVLASLVLALCFGRKPSIDKWMVYTL